MNEEQVTRAIGDMERAFQQEDPGFLRRFHWLEQRQLRADVTVFFLLALGAVLLTIGFATFSWPIWAAGLAVLLMSAVVGEHYRHLLQRPR